MIAKCCAAVSFILLCPGAVAQNWPAKPIRFIVPFAAAGSTDLVARVIAERLSVALGQQIIVDNRSGGNGVIGTGIAAKAAADGYSYVVVFDSHATNPSLQKHIAFDTRRDFAPIMLIATSPMSLVVNPATPYRSLGDLIAAAKARPGDLILGSGGIGSRGHLAVALLESKAGFKITQVPYKGTAQITNDLLAGHITMQMGTVFFVSPYVKAQRLRALAVTAARRVSQMPEVPTVAEQGYPGYEVHSWWGILAPAGIPTPIRSRMHAELARVLAAADVQERLANLGLSVRASAPAEFARFIETEMEFWGKVVRDSRISVTE